MEKGKLRFIIVTLYVLGDMIFRSEQINDLEMFFGAWLFVVPVTLVGGLLADIVFNRLFIYQRSNPQALNVLVCTIDLIIAIITPTILLGVRSGLSTIGISIFKFGNWFGDFFTVAAILAFMFMIVFRLLLDYAVYINGVKRRNRA